MTTLVVIGLATLLLGFLAMLLLEVLSGPPRWVPPTNEPARVEPVPLFDWARERPPWLTGEHPALCICSRCVE